MTPVNTRVLVTVMTYPHPSESYVELVCTAGITESREWVRLYPIDYRYMSDEKRYHKYQWIDVELEPRGAKYDNRKESRKPVLDSIVPGERIDTDGGTWRRRRALIDAMPHHTLRQLRELHSVDKTSLGIVRPRRVLDMTVKRADPADEAKWMASQEQTNLFAAEVKELRKLPYVFRYAFECEDDDKPHEIMIEDWELGVLFLKEAARLGSDEKAADSVRSKFLDEICRADRDTRFFMGTHFPYNTWLVLGVFWPPRTTEEQTDLF